MISVRMLLIKEMHTLGYPFFFLNRYLKSVIGVRFINSLPTLRNFEVFRLKFYYLTPNVTLERTTKCNVIRHI